MKKIEKIIILGGPGSGKTTLAKLLGTKYNLPVVNLDGLNYFENWVERDKEERDNIILEKIKEKQWIIEGNYKKTLKDRAKKADLIVFLDYPTIILLKGILERNIKNFNKEKEEIKGCKERVSKKFLKYALKYNKNKKQIFEILNNIENINDKLVIIKSRKKLNKWLEEN